MIRVRIEREGERERRGVGGGEMDEDMMRLTGERGENKV